MPAKAGRVMQWMGRFMAQQNSAIHSCVGSVQRASPIVAPVVCVSFPERIFIWAACVARTPRHELIRCTGVRGSAHNAGGGVTQAAQIKTKRTPFTTQARAPHTAHHPLITRSSGPETDPFWPLIRSVLHFLPSKLPRSPPKKALLCISPSPAAFYP